MRQVALGIFSFPGNVQGSGESGKEHKSGDEKSWTLILAPPLTG